MKVPYGMKLEGSDASARPAANGHTRRQPEFCVSVGTLSEEDSKRFQTTLDWFLADIVQRVMAKREKEVGGKFEAQR